jgi:beta-lactamase superfamily II metal-dependent hydrolase
VVVLDRALSGLLVMATALFSSATSAVAASDNLLPAWTEGYLYIHHISTGRGNATYFVLPDGTTLLIDAGEADPKFAESVRPLKPFPPRPDGAHSAAWWIADYIRQFAPAGRPVKLDYALITHFHTDHMGTITPSSPLSRTGAYRLAGITELAELLPVATLIDRAAPSYDYPVDLHQCARGGFDGLSLANYLSFASYRLKQGQAVVGLKPGALDQIKLGKDDAFPGFHIRNIASNGIIWAGGDDTQYYIPKGAITDCHFDENPFSNVLTIAYGKFKYYTGGDIPGVPNYTQPWWRDVETPVSAVVGPVDVMLLDHHGNRDSTNENILRNLQPRVIVQENWLSPQPGEEVVTRMASKGLYPGPRDVFSTGMLAESRIVIGPIMDSLYKSYGGHVVVRVAPGGDQYEVYVLNDTDKRREVVKRFGSYQSKSPVATIARRTDRVVQPGVISTAAAEVRIAYRPDGRQIAWGSIGRNADAGQQDIWEMHQTASGWSPPARASFDTDAVEFDPAFSSDSRHLFFDSDRAGGLGGTDVYIVDVDLDTNQFSTPRNLGARVNSKGDEWAPTPTPRGSLIFSSDGWGGEGQHDLFESDPELKQPPRNLGRQINGPEEDFDAALTPDGKTLVFSSGTMTDTDAHVSLYRSQWTGKEWTAREELELGCSDFKIGSAFAADGPDSLFYSAKCADGLGRMDIREVNLK